MANTLPESSILFWYAMQARIEVHDETSLGAWGTIKSNFYEVSRKELPLCFSLVLDSSIFVVVPIQLE